LYIYSAVEPCSATSGDPLFSLVFCLDLLVLSRANRMVGHLRYLPVISKSVLMVEHECRGGGEGGFKHPT